METFAPKGRAPARGDFPIETHARTLEQIGAPWDEFRGAIADAMVVSGKAVVFHHEDLASSSLSGWTP